MRARLLGAVLRRLGLLVILSSCVSGRGGLRAGDADAGEQGGGGQAQSHQDHGRLLRELGSDVNARAAVRLHDFVTIDRWRGRSGGAMKGK